MDRNTAANGSHAIAGNQSDKRAGRGYSWAWRLLIALGVIFVLCIVVQLIASPLAKHMINKKLASMPDYRGQVGKVNLALWRGGLELGDLVLYSRNGQSVQGQRDLPLARVKKVSAKLVPLALFSGKLEGELTIDEAELNVVQNESFPAAEKVPKSSEETKRTAQETKQKIASWQETLGKTFPMEMTRFEVMNSKMRFIDPAHQPNVDVGIQNLHILATGLRNRTEGDPLPAKVELTGTTTGDGRLKVNVQADPLSKTPRFAEKMELVGLSLPALNSFMLAYSGLDVSKGTFDFYNEAKAEGGRYNGYVKPFVHDVDFKHNPSDKDKPLSKKVIESVANAATGLLKNKEEKKIATEAPFSGTFDKNNVDVWTTIDLLLRNAFIQGLKEGFSGLRGSS